MEIHRYDKSDVPGPHTHFQRGDLKPDEGRKSRPIQPEPGHPGRFSSEPSRVESIHRHRGERLALRA